MDSPHDVAANVERQRGKKMSAENNHNTDILIPTEFPFKVDPVSVLLIEFSNQIPTLPFVWLEILRE